MQKITKSKENMHKYYQLDNYLFMDKYCLILYYQICSLFYLDLSIKVH